MKIKQLLIAVCIGLMFAACSNHYDEAIDKNDNAIKFCAKVVSPTPATRALPGTESNLLNTSIGDGAKVRVCFYETGTNNPIISHQDISGITTGRPYTAHSSGELTADTEDPTWGEKNIDVFAYYPAIYCHDFTGDYFSVASDQKTTSQKTSDILLAKQTNIAKTNGPITLEFKHVYSKITVKLDNGTSGLNCLDAKNVKIRCLRNCYLKKVGSEIEVDQSTLKNYEGYYYDIQIGDYTSESGLYGIIPPQTIDKSNSYLNNTFISFTINGTTYSYMPDSPITFKSGYEYTFTLTLDNSAVKAKNFTVSPWDGSQAECTVYGSAVME